MLEFRDGQVDAGDGARLAQAMRDEIAVIYAGLDLDGPQMPKAGAAELNPPARAFLVGYLDGRPVCCGASVRALYVSAGYTPVPDFNANPVAAFWGEKALI